ncbi:MAG: zinc-dependent alcohol dehydrogenase [Persicimonas sp.]
MKAVCWMGKEDMQVRDVPEPTILNSRDCIIKVTLTAICGSDLHLYDGYIPTMKEGDIMGHETVGEVVEIGSEVNNLSVGDRVVIPFPIACGSCHYCQHDKHSLCDNSNPNAQMAEKAYGYSTAGIFGYSHMMGGYAGGQAEYLRVPFADVGPMKIPDGVSDEQAFALADIFPTGYHAAMNCDIKDGDTVAVWGCGPVGLFSMKSAKMLGAERVIAIDRVPERLEKARREGGADEVLHFEKDKVMDELKEMTGGRGPDAVIEAVGMEAHGVTKADHFYDKAKQTLRLETDRPNALRHAIMACGKGGNVSIPGVFGGVFDKMPMGAAFAKALTFKMGQTPVQAYMQKLMDHIENGDIDPSFVITHRVPLVEAPAAYKMFREKEDNCIKVVMRP